MDRILAGHRHILKISFFCLFQRKEEFLYFLREHGGGIGVAEDPAYARGLCDGLDPRSRVIGQHRDIGCAYF